MTMTTPDTFTLLDPSAAADAFLTVPAYAVSMGATVRTVRRWLADGALPGAHKDAEGTWMIPSSVQPERTGRGRLVALEQKAVASPDTSPVTLTGMLDEQPAFLTVEVAARLLGVSEYTVRARRDLFGTQRVGRALMVPQRTVRELAGLTAAPLA